jgi:hypothetical protein
LIAFALGLAAVSAVVGGAVALEINPHEFAIAGTLGPARRGAATAKRTMSSVSSVGVNGRPVTERRAVRG